MNEVTRYDLTEDVSTGEVDITPVPERMQGRYVTFEDYEALQQQLTATTNSLTNAQEALKSAGIEADTVQAGVIELVNRMNQLVAENVMLSRHVIDSAVAVEHWNSWADAQDRIERAPETPATDTYLSAVRAEGVEMFGNSDFCPEEMGIAVNEFANLLRAGNADKDGV